MLLKNINEKFSVNENSIDFTKNEFEFNFEAYNSFKKLNKILNFNEKLKFEIENNRLKVSDNNNLFFFKIKKIENDDLNFQKKYNDEKIIENLKDKYKKYFKQHKDFLNILKFDKELYIYSSTCVLKIYDNLDLDFDFLYHRKFLEKGSDSLSFNNHFKLIKMATACDYNKYFTMPKCINYGLITIDIKNDYIYNQAESQKSKISSSENFEFSKDIYFSEKIMKLCKGNKIFINLDNNANYFFKVELKNMEAFFFAGKK